MWGSPVRRIGGGLLPPPWSSRAAWDVSMPTLGELVVKVRKGDRVAGKAMWSALNLPRLVARGYSAPSALPRCPSTGGGGRYRRTVDSKSFTVPADDSSRLDEDQGTAPPRPHSPKPYPEDPIAVLQASCRIQ